MASDMDNPSSKLYQSNESVVKLRTTGANADCKEYNILNGSLNNSETSINNRENGKSGQRRMSSTEINHDGASNQCTFERLLIKNKLLTRNQIPKHLQFNPYIDSGYRPLLDGWGCVKSLFYFHNETVNIITHGIPMLYILLCWQTLLPWGEINVPILPWTHLVSTVSPWVGSTIYHLFMNHDSGEACYKSLLHLDMFGIWITQSFGALTTVYASVSCLTTAWIWKVLAVYCCVSLWCLYKAFHARSPLQRRFCFTLPFLMRSAALAIRWSSWGGGNPNAFPHIIYQDLLAVLGGFVGALRIPEKWIPGCLDLFANSHHIMHIVVVYAVYHLHQGAVLDMLWLSDPQNCPATLPSSSTV